MIEFKPGDQIIYIPCHANNYLDHPDCEYGFVTSIAPNNTSAFCRYWNKFDPRVLRTRANSEATPMNRLKHYSYKPQKVVDYLLARIQKGEDV